MFEFMTFVLKFGIFHLIMFQLGIFMSDGQMFQYEIERQPVSLTSWNFFIK